jgi:AbrB family looped-hinge helix DNA binding protein
MTVSMTIDEAGRVVIPKAVRDHLHLHAGSRIKGELHGEAFTLTEEPAPVKLIRNKKGRRVVVCSEPVDAAAAVREMRDELAQRGLPAWKR